MKVIIMVGPSRCGKTRLAKAMYEEHVKMGREVVLYFGGSPNFNNKKLIACCEGKRFVCVDDMSKKAVKNIVDVIDDPIFRDVVDILVLIPPYIPESLCIMPGIEIWDEKRIYVELHNRGIYM